MPLHRVYAAKGVFKAEEKAAIAESITRVYSVLPPFYVVVVFVDVEEDSLCAPPRGRAPPRVSLAGSNSVHCLVKAIVWSVQKTRIQIHICRALLALPCTSANACCIPWLDFPVGQDATGCARQFHQSDPMHLASVCLYEAKRMLDRRQQSFTLMAFQAVLRMVVPSDLWAPAPHWYQSILSQSCRGIRMT